MTNVSLPSCCHVAKICPQRIGCPLLCHAQLTSPSPISHHDSTAPSTFRLPHSARPRHVSHSLPQAEAEAEALCVCSRNQLRNISFLLDYGRTFSRRTLSVVSLTGVYKIWNSHASLSLPTLVWSIGCGSIAGRHLDSRGPRIDP